MQAFTFFLSYRRADTASVALLLKYEIEKRLQFVRAVVDVTDIHPGQPFPDRIKSLIDKSHATIVLIGPNWMPVADADPPAAPVEDWVVSEIDYSLTAPLRFQGDELRGLKERVVIPVFVGMTPDFRNVRLPPRIARLATAQAEQIMHESWPSQIGPLLDGIATTYGLKTRPDSDAYPIPDPAKARTQPMLDEELRKILSFDDYEGWYVDNFGNSETTYLAKTFRFKGFDQAADFMHAVTSYCRILDHHPEWRNVFDHVTVALTTWDARRRVTIYDLNLALYMNKAAAAVMNGRLP